MYKRTVFFSLFTFVFFVVNAKVKVDGIWYNIDEENKTATIVRPTILLDGHEFETNYRSPVVIPEKFTYNSVDYIVTAFGDRAFGGYDGQELTIPSSVIMIGSNAFDGSYLTSLTIPNSVTTIGHHAFSECHDLSSLTIPNSVTSIGNGAFFCCYSLETLSLPDKLTSVGFGLFQGCKNLTNVNLPSTVSTIGDYAFEGCHSLQSISIPKNVVSIGRRSFDGCLTDIYCYTEDVPLGFDSMFYYSANCSYKSVADVTLHVHDYAVETFKALNMGFKDIVVFDKVTNFNLTYYVDEEVYKTEQHKYEEEITTEPEPTRKGMTFSGWSEIPEKMPAKDVTVIGTFSWAKETIRGVIYQVTDTINNNAAVIGNDNASGEVKIVSSVNFDYDYSITDIVDFAFKNNTDITSVVIPKSVRKIGDEVFYGCKNLAKIEIGKSVNQVEPRAFAGIDKLTDITVYAEDVPDADRTAFENSYIEDYVTLHVPAGSLEKYKSTAPWKNFKEIVAIEGTESEPAKYTLTYLVDGETYQEYELEEGAEITALEAPTKEGYTFSGWSEIPETMPAEDVTITGTFLLATDVDEITIKDTGKTTWCSEYDLDFTNVAGVKAYTATGYNNITKTIWLTRVMEVPAGTGILVKGDAGTYKIPHAEVQSAYANWFVGNLGETISISATDGDKTNYYLSGKDGTFKSVNGSANIGKNKAYLQLPTSVFGGTRSIGICYDDEDGTTGIKNLTPALSEGEGEWYTLQGQRVAKPGKGLYIRNGKKVIVR